MKILDVLQKESIISDLKSQDKKGILEELVAPIARITGCLLYTSPSPRDVEESRMPSSA